tara:strand:- start:398 stop:820 length:423 start_codon:yes stop_codon:yes gene_type:complete
MREYFDLIAIVFAFVFPPLGLFFGFKALKYKKENSLAKVAIVFSSVFLLIYALVLVSMLWLDNGDKEFVLRSCEIYCGFDGTDVYLEEDLTFLLAEFGVNGCDEFVQQFYPEKYDEYQRTCNASLEMEVEGVLKNWSQGS